MNTNAALKASIIWLTCLVIGGGISIVLWKYTDGINQGWGLHPIQLFVVPIILLLTLGKAILQSRKAGLKSQNLTLFMVLVSLILCWAAGAAAEPHEARPSIPLIFPLIVVAVVDICIYFWAYSRPLTPAQRTTVNLGMVIIPPVLMYIVILLGYSKIY